MKLKIENIKLYSILLLALLLGACSRPVVKLEQIPENTPPGSRIFITGNFNRWDPGDQRFMLEMAEDSNYYIELPSGFGQLEYKLTRGDWTSVETDICGFEIANHSFEYGSSDTLPIEVLSWRDVEPVNCPEVTIVLNSIPDDTPENDPIAIAGNFNEWLPDSNSTLKRDSSTGKYMIKLPRIGDNRLIEFKLTRGNLLTAEADRFGNEIDRRSLLFGNVDTLYVDVESWEDIREVPPESVTFILDRIPEALENENIYLTGTFNGWYPRDGKYMFQKNSRGKYQLLLPRGNDEVIQYKITRGDWSKEEVSYAGYKLSNREYRFGTEDTVHLSIAGWLDRSETRSPVFTFIIDRVPPGTPTDARLYMASSVNGWNPNKRGFRFTEWGNGKYYLTLEDTWPDFEFKITRGSWRTQEVDEYGMILNNRIFNYNGVDTIRISIENWKDIPAIDQEKVVIVIDELPDYTPEGQKIYITGTFNDWLAEDPDYIMSRNLKGQYYITIPKWANEIEYKFTLGSWEREELDEWKNTISNRYYQFGYADTVYVKVGNWEGIR
jgi:hypothetical protein